VPFENIVFDYHTVASFKDDADVDRQRHVVVMAYRDTVERYHAAVTGAGLKVRRIDFSAFALLRSGISAASRAAMLEAYGSDITTAVCDIGETSTNLVIASDGICELNRIIDFGAQTFTHTLMEQFGWTEEDAARVRFDAGVMVPGGVEMPGDPYAESRQIMQFVNDQLASELRQSFDYLVHVESGSRVGRLVICGIGAMFRGIAERLAHDLGIPVEYLNLAPFLDTDSLDSLGAAQLQVGTAFGLALEDAA